MMMIVMRVGMTIRTGRCAAPHSAARFTRVPATRLAQSHPSPQVARELPHFLWKRHRLIEIGQELTKDISSWHLLWTPRHFSSIVSFSHVLIPVRDFGEAQAAPVLQRVSWSLSIQGFTMIVRLILLMVLMLTMGLLLIAHTVLLPCSADAHRT
jgi:hypothetical protein